MCSAPSRKACKGQRAVDWRLVDEVVPNSQVRRDASPRAPREFAAALGPPGRHAQGIALAPLARDDRATTRSAIRPWTVEIDRAGAHGRRSRSRARRSRARDDADDAGRCGRRVLAAARSRASSTTRSCICASTSPRSGVWSFKHRRAIPSAVLAHDALLAAQRRPLARARDPALLEARAQARRRDLALAGRAGRAGLAASPARWPRLAVRRRPRATCWTAQFEGDNRPPADAHAVGRSTSAAYPMTNGLTRLADPLPRRAEALDACARRTIGEPLEAEEAEELGLVTFASTTSTGRTRSASSSRSARASRPTR